MRLYWVDILGGALHRLDFTTDEHTVIEYDEAITCVVRHADGGLVAAMRSGLWHLDAEGGRQARLAEAPEDTRDHRFNDGGCDPAGRFWIGTMNETQSDADASLYCYDGSALGSPYRRHDHHQRARLFHRRALDVSHRYAHPRHPSPCLRSGDRRDRAGRNLGRSEHARYRRQPRRRGRRCRGSLLDRAVRRRGRRPFRSRGAARGTLSIGGVAADHARLRRPGRLHAVRDHRAREHGRRHAGRMATVRLPSSPWPWTCPAVRPPPSTRDRAYDHTHRPDRLR